MKFWGFKWLRKSGSKGWTDEARKKSAEARKKVDIPKFKRTQDAVAFGKLNKHNAEVTEQLKILREQLLGESKVALQSKNYQLAMNKGVEAQFYREALENEEISKML
jgi:hypothetical protein